MKCFDIMLKDLYQIFKDWKPVIFLVVAPIIFTLMFGFMFGGFAGPDGTQSDDRLPVRIVGLEETAIHSSLLDFLQNSSVIRIETGKAETTLKTHQEDVSGEKIAAAILIPNNFTKNLQETGLVKLDVILDENTTAGVTVQQEIQSAMSRLQTAAVAADLTISLYEEKQGIANPQERDALYAKAFNNGLKAWENPPVVAEETRTSPGAEESGTSEENAFAQSLPGMMAQFAIAGLIGAAEIIVQERKSGSLERLKTTAVSRFEILVGHWLAMFVMILIQFIVLITFGQVFLKLNFLTAPLATLVLAFACCAFVASLGLLIGILARLPEQTAIFALIPMFLFSGLGGAWMPLELLGETVRTVAKFTPVAWIMIGYKDILLRGAHLAQVALPIMVLLGFAVLFFVPAVILFYKKN